MLTSRLHLSGLFAVLLALMAQLGTGAAVPRIDPAALAAAGELCQHSDDGGRPGHAPHHPADCLICPLCAVLHAQPAALAAALPAVVPPSELTVVRPELPPPATAPPSLGRPPIQPRAPPTLS